MFKVYFSNFHYYSANISNTIDAEKKVARAAGFDSVIEENGEAVCTYSSFYGFVNLNPVIIGMTG